MKTGTVRRKFGRFIIHLFFVIVGVVGAYRGLNIVCTIRTIEIVGDGFDVQIDQKRISQNLLFFPSEKMRAQILAENPTLKDVQFIKRFPSTLRIVPVLRIPFVMLKLTDRFILVDREGVAVAYGNKNLPLPIVELSISNIRIGETVHDKRLSASLEFLEGVASLFPINSVTELDGRYLLARNEEIDIYIPQNRPMTETLTTLQTLITGFRIKGTLPTVVDLRFDKPIVKF
jgi:hypothetical protein